MRKVSQLILFFLFFFGKVQAQNNQTLEEIGRLLNDALFYSEKYITPATDVAVYQASSGWMTSLKKKELGEVTFGIHSNLFFVPKADRTFKLNNADLEFFEIQDQQTITVPSALGNNDKYVLIGQLDGSEVRLKTLFFIDCIIVNIVSIRTFS